MAKYRILACFCFETRADNILTSCFLRTYIRVQQVYLGVHDVSRLHRLEMEKLIVEAKINKLANEGGIKSDLFWKIRKQILNRGTEKDDYDIITEEGERLTDPEISKEYTASYYENLYQPREGTPECEKFTTEIENKVKEIELEMKNLPEEPDFNTKEMARLRQTIKGLLHSIHIRST